MALPKYTQSRKDFEFLESVVQLSDHVPLMDELEFFMQEPTRGFACRLYCTGVELWFQEHDIEDIPTENKKRVRGIAKRHVLDV